MNSVYAKLNSLVKRQRGTSLVEILVVLVILVFGILSVIRLFPAGFLVFRAAQNNGVGQRMGQSLLESVSKDISAIADGVYIYRDDIGYDPTIAPDDLTHWKTAPTDPAYMDINKARRVINETITVPAARSVTPKNGQYSWASVHVLNYGPVVVTNMAPRVVLLSAPNSIKINSMPWTARIANSLPSTATSDQGTGTAVDDPAALLSANSGAQEYLIDYDTQSIAVPQETYSRNFVFSVMTDQGPGITDTYFVAGGTASVWGSLTLKNPLTGAALPSTAVWTSGTAVLYVPFTPLEGGDNAAASPSTASQWSSNPYEFQLRAGNVAPNVNMGVIDFNPLAAGGNGLPPLKARISYTVYNWHVLHEDRDLPVASDDRTLRLAIDNLKKVGDPQYDQTLFQGIFGSAAPADLVVCNLENGDSEAFSSSTNAADLDGDSPSKTTVGISYKNGRVTFPSVNPDPNYSGVYTDTSATPNSNGLHLRIYYMGQADWGVALQKAPASYLPTTDINDLVKTRADIYGPVNIYHAQVDAGPTSSELNVYFPFCDFGKTVEISSIQYTNTQGVNETFPGSAVTSAITKTFTVAGKSVGYVDVGAMPSDYDPSKPIVINSVRGISANALVVWRENDQWKHRTIDTLLPRTQ